MKHIKAVIRPEKLNDVREALEKAGCHKGLMITEIVGHGNQKGVSQMWRGEKYEMDLIPKVMLDIVVSDDDAPKVTKAVLVSAPVGDFGDGKIFVYPVEDVIRIRTGESGEKAL